MVNSFSFSMIFSSSKRGRSSKIYKGLDVFLFSNIEIGEHGISNPDSNSIPVQF